jgi:hypothetical protein
MSETSPEATAGAEGAPAADPAAQPAAPAPVPGADDRTPQQMLADAMAEGGTGDGDGGAEGAPAETDPAKALEQALKDAEKWKQLSRKNEARARENSTAADELKKIRDSQMSEQERLTAQLAEAQETAARERTERLRLVAAASYDLPAEALDLLRGSTEDEINENAERLAALINSRSAAASSTAEGAAAAARSARPVESLRPGALPAGDARTSNDPNSLFRQMAGLK